MPPNFLSKFVKSGATPDRPSDRSHSPATRSLPHTRGRISTAESLDHVLSQGADFPYQASLKPEGMAFGSHLHHPPAGVRYVLVELVCAIDSFSHLHSAVMLSSGRKDNKPLMTALALELLALNLRRVPSPSSALERSEYARRDRDITWYLLRGSIWDTWTRCVSCSRNSMHVC